MEPDLYNSSIYSFGYDSDWGSLNPSVLSVHDFGQALYEELRSSPYLRQMPDSPIIIIGHSMGGLVIKKAYILAHQDLVHGQLAERIRCIFFLATPHKGSEYAPVLNKILGMTGITSSREYVSELSQGSISARIINEDFGRYASTLRIYSFFETLETNLGISSSLIVDKDSAILGPGFSNETSRYMNANHRGTCKFDSLEDPNYQSLKNSLATAVRDLLQEPHEETSKMQLRKLRTFIGVSGPPDDNYEQLEGSCLWIDNLDHFRQWRDAEVDIHSCQSLQNMPSIYWVTANPGAGKTVLAAHIVNQLVQHHRPHAFYYFKVGKRASLAGCLRSLAFQTATVNSAILSTLSTLSDDDATVDLDDARAIWLKVFKAGILQTSGVTAQYRILDALDEHFDYPELFKFLKGLQVLFPLKIFITSRKLPDLPKLVRQLGDNSTHVVELPVIETMRDIDLYIRDRMQFLPIDKDEDKENLAKEISSKLKASSLWVRLVLDELESVYGYESIKSVPHGIPEGMLPYYRRIITGMQGNKREKHLIQTVLTWVVCASRPLTILELSEALRIDINVNLASAKTAVEALCGQIISVDKNSGLVQIVHATAIEFLLSSEAGEFRISRSEANERLAITCLQLLVSPAMQPPRHRRLLAQTPREQLTSPLLDYAITQFSDHIISSPAQSEKLFKALDRFLYTTVLSWVERIVAGKGIHYLIRAARNLKAYIDIRAQHTPPSGQNVDRVACWVEDLSRLVMKFGRALILQPRSIYFLIPPLCPGESAIYRQFGKSPDSLTVLGLSNQGWHDCVATVSFEGDEVATVVCEGPYIAVGFRQRNIRLYSHTSYHKVLEISHAYQIECLALDPSGASIVSACTEYITVWDLDGVPLWQKPLGSRCRLLTVSSAFVICVTLSGQAIWWDIATGEQMEYHYYPYQHPVSQDQLSTEKQDALSPEPPEISPHAGSFSPGLELLALAYGSRPICIFELRTRECVAWAVDDNCKKVIHLAFNPNPEINSLLVAYDDSHLSLYEPWSGILMHSREPHTQAALQSLSCSPDGCTFSTMDAYGNLRIWEFESLTPLYHALTTTSFFRSLNYTSHEHILINLANQEFRVWSPSALVPIAIQEGNKIRSHASILPLTTASEYEQFRSARLQVAVLHEQRPILVAGNYKGDVKVYDQDGNETGVLYSHQSSLVTSLVLSKADDVASCDNLGVVQVWQLDTSRLPVIKPVKRRFRVNHTTTVRQMVFDNEGRYLLVSMGHSDLVYEVATGNLVGSQTFGDERRIWRWTYLPVPSFTGSFILVCDGGIVCYSAMIFPSQVRGGRIALDIGFRLTKIESIIINPETSTLVLAANRYGGYLDNSILLIYQIPELFELFKLFIPRQVEVAAPIRPSRVLSSKHYMCCLGIDQADGKLVFLHRNSWVCSISLSTPADGHYKRHLFVPGELTTRVNNIYPLLTRDKAVIFAFHNRFAVIRNGMVFPEVAEQDEDWDSMLRKLDH